MLKKRAILKSSGQLWVAEEDVRAAGYDPVLGCLVEINGSQTFFELASRVVPFKVGLKADGFVWWLLPVRH